jgi:hypothetical protein
MKTRLLITLLFLAGFSGCKVEEDPYGFYSENNFYKTAEDAQSALYYSYNAFTNNEYARAIFYIHELASETCDVKSEEAFGAQEINNWTRALFKNNEQLELFFKYSYIGINRANAVIENVGGSKLDEELKKRIIGEAHFLRAYNYYNLASTYGLVPIQSKMVSTQAQTNPPLPANLDELYDFIISDCLIAEQQLRVNRVVGCVDKVAAQSLLAKAYLTLASSKQSNLALYRDSKRDFSLMYDSAAYWSGKVLYEQSEYKLDNDLLNIYDVKKPNGPEHIFILSMDKTGIQEGNFSSIDKMFIPYKNGSNLWFKNPDETFTKATSNGWGVFLITDQFANTYENKDKRKSVLMSKRYYTNSTGSTWDDNPTYLTRKFIDPDYIGVKSSVRPFLIRFSDIALVYAEAKGPTTEGYEWLNKIRERAGLDEAPAGLGITQFRNFVVDERALELAFEGKRLYDLRRKAIVTVKDPKAAASGISEAEAAFYPIPQKEIDLNPNLRQK